MPYTKRRAQPEPPPWDVAAAHLAAGSPQQALQVVGQAWAAGERNAALCNVAGVCAVQMGFSEEAERLWQEAILLAPTEAEPHFNLGLLYARSGREEASEAAYRRAIALNPAHSWAHSNLGLLLERMDRSNEAEACYREALACDPNNAAAQANLGVWLAQQGRHIEAEAAYRNALAINPQDADTLSNLGVSLGKLRRWVEAETCHRQALAINPDHIAAWLNLGVQFGELKGWAEAERCQREALARDPDNVRALANLGLALEGQKHWDVAADCFRRALALDASVSEIHSNLGNLLAHRGQLDEAEATLRQAIALAPDSAIAHANLGVLLVKAGREPEAEACLRQALAVQPDYQLARLNLGFLLLGQGRLAEGWVLHEARYHPDLPDNAIPMPHADYPCWQGERLEGKSILVMTEQGLGDELHFCRYLPLLKQRGARQLTFCCKPALRPLLETLEGVDTLCTVQEQTAQAPHDYWVMLLSLPLRFGTTLDNIPARLPYLHAPTRNMGFWQTCLPEGGLRVGLAWRGNPDHDNDADRSLPDLSVLAPLWSVPGVRFFSLQKGTQEADALSSPHERPLVALGQDLHDFADTAAIVAQLDLVICVDTSLAHLAGALNIPCWVMLPAYRPDWRWLQGRSDSPWYPGALRLFRQTQRQDWAGVVEALRLALHCLVKTRASTNHSTT